MPARFVASVRGLDVEPGAFVFSVAGYAYRFVEATGQSVPGYSAGQIRVRPVGYVDGQQVEGDELAVPADLFDVIVRRVS